MTLKPISLRSYFFDELEPIFGLSETTAMWKHFSIYKLKSNRLDEDLKSVIPRIKDNYPIQYITGETAFYDVLLKVTPEVLIPRPETEELVDWIIKDHKSVSGLSILDIGTGSGCIIITLAKHLHCEITTGIDVSESALDIAKYNAEQCGVRVSFDQVDILATKPSHLSKVDILVSNPPYISQTERRQMTRSTLKHEPDVALFGPDKNPLYFYEWIAKNGVDLLKTNGSIYVELNALAYIEIKSIFDRYNWKTEMRKDIYGNWRMLKAVCNGEE